MRPGTRALLLGLAIRALFALVCGTVGALLGVLLRPFLRFTPTEAGVLICCIALGLAVWLCCRR